MISKINARYLAEEIRDEFLERFGRTLTLPDSEIFRVAQEWTGRSQGDDPDLLVYCALWNKQYARCPIAEAIKQVLS